jgi:hypothetical protein
MLNDYNLLIPERPENKLLHGLGNILRTGRIGLVFVIPGTEETLRVNGSAFFSSRKHLSRVMLGYRQVGSSHKRSVLKHKSPETRRGKLSRIAIEKAVDAVVNQDY